VSGWLGVSVQLGAVAINLATAWAFYRTKGDAGLAVAFIAYAVACGGYAYSIYRSI